MTPPSTSWSVPSPEAPSGTSSGSTGRDVQWVLPGKDVLLPVRSGGQSATTHQIMLRFGDASWDGSVAGYLVAQTSRGPIAARHAIRWDPLLDAFAIGDQAELEWLFERLDLVSALAGTLRRMVAGAARVAGTVMCDLLAPRFFIVGGLGAIVIGYLFYYWLWLLLAQWLLLCGLLPGAVIVMAFSVLYEWRLVRLRRAMFQGAWHALHPEMYHAPR